MSIRQQRQTESGIHLVEANWTTDDVRKYRLVSRVDNAFDVQGPDRLPAQAIPFARSENRTAQLYE
jgi:hypothetical protein